jgi:protein-disulfide isomerase
MKPTTFLACAAALIAIAGCNSKQGDAATNAPVKITPVKPPKNGDWATIVSQTPEGGMLMGNPNAKVHLIEYGSMTCPHCQHFDETGVTPLINNYVKTGQVSYEFRNYVRDAFDLTATLIARCNGPDSFFPLARALYKDQPNWVKNIQSAPQDQLEALQNLPPNQQFLQAAKIAGLQDWATARGVPQAKSAQCLTDESKVNQLVQWTGDVTDRYPDFKGTPTFILNGKMVDLGTVTEGGVWGALETHLKAALSS